jgi:hypothetical protein
MPGRSAFAVTRSLAKAKIRYTWPTAGSFVAGLIVGRTGWVESKSSEKAILALVPFCKTVPGDMP